MAVGWAWTKTPIGAVMSIIARSLITVSLLFVPGAIFGQTNQSAPEQGDSNMSCVERLEIPGYPALAAQARIQGTITVSVALASDGRVGKVETEAASKYSQARSLFGTPVWKAIREAKFRADCGGKTVRLIFHFDLEGIAGLQTRASVLFGYPNTFWIIAAAQLVQPTVGRP